MRDPVHYAGILYALDDPRAELKYESPDGVLVRYNALEYMSARTENAMREMLPRVRSNDAVSFEPIFDAPLAELGFTQDLVCHSCLYERTAPVELTLPAGVEIRRLTHDWAGFVLEHYSHADGDADYVANRVDNGMWGLFERDGIAGFIGVHNSGEMGLLEILPPFRRKGYARLLEAYLINVRLRDGLMVYCDVETKNEPSLKLQRGLGMTISDKSNAWCVR